MAKKIIRKKIIHTVIFATCVFCFITGCKGMPSGKESPSIINPESSAEPITITSKAETDPYTEYREGKGIPEKIDLFFFYENNYAPCNEPEKFNNTVSDKLPPEIRNSYPHTIYTINTAEIDGRKTYEQITDAMGLDRKLLSQPLLIAGGRVYQGHETIAANILEAFLTAGEDIFVNHNFYNPALRKTGGRLYEDYSVNTDHVTMVYFYRIVCPDCNRIKPLIDGLPKTVARGGKEVPLDIVRINTRSGNNNERVADFFDRYRVPNEDRMVPIIFFGDGYLAGVESITGKLQEKLAAIPSGNMPAEIIN